MGIAVSHLNRFDVGALALCGILIGILRSFHKRKHYSEGPLPPGPKPLPILRNTFDMPWRDDHLTLTRWGKQYGDVVLVSLLGGRDVVYLNSAKAASDLLEKRSSIYSDRPRLPLVADSAGTDWNFGLTPYGDNWRLHRKLFVSKFGIQKATNYAEVQEHAMKLFLRLLLQSPEQFLDHVELHAGRLIMKVVYDIQVESREDEYMSNLRTAAQLLSEATRPISYLAESIPIVKHFNALWPGVLGKRSVTDMRNVTEEMTNAPFAAAKARMAQGGHDASFVSDVVEQQSGKDSPANEQVIRETAATAFAAGAETTTATTAAFILAMVIYPDVQLKAQAEIDRVVGRNRFPTFEDKDALPYVFAVFMETLRWHTVFPQGVPHRLQVEDTYCGYILPSGATIVVNAWGILHDVNEYPDPMAFKPERYLSEDGNLDFSVDPRNVAFGFGRRVCAGMHFAENSLWIFIAQVLATMNISNKVDEQGEKIEARLEPTSGLVSRPAPFQCSMIPRSERAREFILKD